MIFGLRQRALEKRVWFKAVVGVFIILLLTVLLTRTDSLVPPQSNAHLRFEYRVMPLALENIKSGYDNKVVIYFNFGKAIHQKDFKQMHIAPSQDWTHVRLELPNNLLHGIRLDPSTFPAIIEIRELQVVDRRGVLLLEVSPNMIQAGNHIRSLTKNLTGIEIETIPDADDPFVNITFGKVLDLEPISADAFEDYVDKYKDLLASYSTSGGNQTKRAWGRNHYCSYGRAEGRTYPGLSVTSCKTFSISRFDRQILINLNRFAFWSFLCGAFIVIIIVFTSFKQTTTISLVVAVLLLFIGTSINSNPSILRQAYQWIDGREGGGKLGIALLAPLRPLADTEFLIRRSGTSKSELPVLRIFMTDGALRELVEKRNRILAENSPILLATDDDWVDATIVWGDGRTQKKTTTTLRLKGDWAKGRGAGPGHLANIRKLSFRIKARNNEQILGMTKFSIQNPAERGYQKEAIAADIMRLFGILSPRYFFVDVRINEQTIGIMALEEHFTKELVKFQKRREGPILAIDDESYWQQMFLNSNRFGDRTEDWINTDLTNMVFRDYPLKVYRMNSFFSDTIDKQQAVRAVSLLRDQIDGRISASLTYDLDVMSRWWILTNILQAHHANSVNNQRFYFNSISNRFEPISFDHAADPERRFRLTTDFAVSSLLTDSKFRIDVWNSIEEIENVLNSDKFKSWFDEQQAQYRNVLDLEYEYSEAVKDLIPIRIEYLVQNLTEFKRELKFIFDVIPVRDYRIVYPLSRFEHSRILVSELLGTTRLEDRINDSIHGQDFMEQSPPLYSHIRPFWFWSKEKSVIEIKNLTVAPVTIHSAFLVEQSSKNLLEARADYQIPVYKEGSRGHIFTMPINLSGLDLDNEMKVSYSYRGTKYTKPVFLQFRHHNSGYEGVETSKRWFHKNRILVDEANQTIIFPRGHHILDKRLEIERDWQTKFLSGAVVEFKQGAALRVNGPIYSLGQKNFPVTLVVHSDPGQGPLSSWGGLVVVNAQTESILRYTRVVGAGESRLPERQDSYGLTGCITFYKSDVLIEDSVFDGLQCEDALNVISANFNFIRLRFIDTSADAFDSDFSTGTVTDSSFENIGNDGIDISGSIVKVKSSQFFDIGDKAISVGERSNLDASGLAIDSSIAGVVSKDKSVVYIRDSSFDNISGSALMAYIKKEQYGPSEIHCTNCEFDNIESVAAKQSESRITIDGKEIRAKPFNRKQLQVAGYLGLSKFSEEESVSVQH